MSKCTSPLDCLVLGLSMRLLLACKSSSVGSEAPPPTVEASTAEVQTAEAKLGGAPTWRLLTGQLRGAHEMDLAANVVGRIVSTKEHGTKVKAGDAITLVDVRAAALTAVEAKTQAGRSTQ